MPSCSWFIKHVLAENIKNSSTLCSQYLFLPSTRFYFNTLLPWRAKIFRAVSHLSLGVKVIRESRVMQYFDLWYFYQTSDPIRPCQRVINIIGPDHNDSALSRPVKIKTPISGSTSFNFFPSKFYQFHLDFSSGGDGCI